MTTFETARLLRELGHDSIPCEGKRPLIAWRKRQTERPTDGDYARWFADARTNVALLCKGIVVVDIDDPAHLEFVQRACGANRPMTKTPRGGFHVWYRARKGIVVPNHVQVRGRKIDIRAEGAIAVVPPSSVGGVPYEWLQEPRAAKDLPVFRVSEIRQRKRRAVVEAIQDSPDVMVRRARAYIATIEGAISGAGGHARTFRVACILVCRFGLSVEQGWPLLKEWNEQCEPPWSDKELRHKLDDALKEREK